jgi:hypothetical protein
MIPEKKFTHPDSGETFSAWLYMTLDAGSMWSFYVWDANAEIAQITVRSEHPPTVEWRASRVDYAGRSDDWWDALGAATAKAVTR